MKGGVILDVCIRIEPQMLRPLSNVGAAAQARDRLGEFVRCERDE